MHKAEDEDKSNEVVISLNSPYGTNNGKIRHGSFLIFAIESINIQGHVVFRTDLV